MKTFLCLLLFGIIFHSSCSNKEETETENTNQLGTLSDIDGNTYKTVTIGTQTWMAENLKTTKYNDGTAIPLVTDGNSWSNLSTPAYCWYNNDLAANKVTYGALYNWYTVNTGKLCPTGWYVPEDLEWAILITYLGGASVAGGKLKETGTSHWQSSKTAATNTTGFSAIPGGNCRVDGSFSLLGSFGYWWTSTNNSSWGQATYKTIIYDFSILTTQLGNYNIGASIRCLKD